MYKIRTELSYSEGWQLQPKIQFLKNIFKEHLNQIRYNVKNTYFLSWWMIASQTQTRIKRQSACALVNSFQTLACVTGDQMRDERWLYFLLAENLRVARQAPGFVVNKGSRSKYTLFQSI